MTQAMAMVSHVTWSIPYRVSHQCDRFYISLCKNICVGTIWANRKCITLRKHCDLLAHTIQIVGDRPMSNVCYIVLGHLNASNDSMPHYNWNWECL